MTDEHHRLVAAHAMKPCHQSRFLSLPSLCVLTHLHSLSCRHARSQAAKREGWAEEQQQRTIFVRRQMGGRGDRHYWTTSAGQPRGGRLIRRTALEADDASGATARVSADFIPIPQQSHDECDTDAATCTGVGPSPPAVPHSPSAGPSTRTLDPVGLLWSLAATCTIARM